MTSKFKRAISFIVSAVIVATIMVTPASTAYINQQAQAAPKITQFEANGTYVNGQSQTLRVAYYLNESAYLTASIVEGGTTINMLFANDFQGKGYNSFTWNGKDEDGKFVDDGDYTVVLYAYNDQGSYTYKYDFHADYHTYNDYNGKKYYDPSNNKSYGDDENYDYYNYSNPSSKDTYLTLQEGSATYFNPLNNDYKIKFELNHNEQVKIDILGTGQVVRNLMGNTTKKANTVYTAVWNGKNNSGNLVEEGRYKYRITLGNGNQYYGDIVLTYEGKKVKIDNTYYTNGNYDEDYYSKYDYKDYNYNNNSSLNVYGQKAVPSTFNPKATKDYSKISYNLSESAQVTVSVMRKNGSRVRYLINGKTQSKGLNSVNFDGRDDDGKYLPEGSYTVEISARKSGASDAEVVKVQLDYGIYSNPGNYYGDHYNYNNIDPKITNYKADPKYFDAEEEKTKITYHTNTDGYVTMKVMDGSKVIKTLIDNDYKDKGDHAQLWDGKDSNNRYVSNGVYQVATWFYNNRGDDYEKINVEVDYSKYTSTYVDPYPSPKKIKVAADNKTYYNDYYDYNNDYYYPTTKVKVLSNADTYNYDYFDYNAPAAKCAGFNDVNESSKYCDAVKYVKDNHIFNGYDNGSFYPNKAIQRDEALRVIMQTFKLSTTPADGTNLGFADVSPNAWYVPYLKAAKFLGIISGYPDGLFRPYQSMNRVEFTKVFVETAQSVHGISIPDCNYKPYVDTPMTWYTDYVCYAKANNLINTVDAFHYQPGKLITRGEVAEFVYNYFGK